MPYRDIDPARMSSEVESMLIKLQGFRLRTQDATTVSGSALTTNTADILQDFEGAESHLSSLMHGIERFEKLVRLERALPHVLDVYCLGYTLRTGVELFASKIITISRLSMEDIVGLCLGRGYTLQLRHRLSVKCEVNFGDTIRPSAPLRKVITEEDPLVLILVDSEGNTIARREFTKAMIVAAEQHISTC